MAEKRLCSYVRQMDREAELCVCIQLLSTINLFNDLCDADCRQVEMDCICVMWTISKLTVICHWFMAGT